MFEMLLILFTDLLF